MRLLNLLFCFLLLVTGSSSVFTRSEANETLKELKKIGETNDPKLLDRKAILSNSLAIFYQSIDDNEQAVVFLEQAIEFTQKRIETEGDWNAQNIRDLQDLYLNLAKVQATGGYLEQAQISFSKAEGYFKQLRPLLEPVEYYETASNVYHTALSYCFHLGAFDLAEKYGRISLDFSQKSNNPKLISESYRFLGEILRKKGDLQNASENFDKAILEFRKKDASVEITQNLIFSKIGNLYAQKRYEDIIAFMENEQLFSSLSDFEKRIQNFSVSEYGTILSNVFVMSYAHIRYYQQSEKVEHLQKAQAWQNSAYKLAEFAVLENGIDRLGQVIGSPQQKITSTLKNYELLEQEGALSQKEIGQLLRTIDVYHSTQLHVNRLKNEINGKDWERQKLLQKDLKRIFEKIKEAEDQGPIIDSLRIRSKAITSELNALATSTKRAEIAKEYQIGQKEFLNRLKQYALRNKKTVVSYYWSQRLSRLFIIGHNPTRPFFKTVTVDPNFIASINRSYQLNSQFLTNEEDLKEQDSLNASLYDILIGSVKSSLTTDNLLVYPIGPMSYVSFDALRPSKNKYLVESRNISYTSSLFSLLRKKRRYINDSRKVMAFQPQHYGDDSLATLFHVKNEIATLDSCTSTATYRGNKATKRAFVANASKAKILHVASHSILDPDNPYESYLIFEEQDSTALYQLKASEIFATSFRADLVVLSSCNSAKGTFSGDIGIVSLSNAFYFSGVPSTLGSLWSAQDQSSSEIVREFYRTLFQNSKKSESLTRSKRMYLSNADVIKRQPFFWANYVLYGDDSVVTIHNEDKSWNWSLWTFGGGAVILLLIYSFFRRSRALS